MSASHVSIFKTLTTKLTTKIEKAKLRMHKAKSSNKHNEAATEPEQRNESEQSNTMLVELNRAGKEVQQQLSQAMSRGTTNQQDKAARRAARKQARKEKWATMRTAFKRKVNKVGEALFVPGVIVGGIILAPVILVAEIVFLALKVVVELVLRILDLIFCGSVLVCFVCTEW